MADDAALPPPDADSMSALAWMLMSEDAASVARALDRLQQLLQGGDARRGVSTVESNGSSDSQRSDTSSSTSASMPRRSSAARAAATLSKNRSRRELIAGRLGLTQTLSLVTHAMERHGMQDKEVALRCLHVFLAVLRVSHEAHEALVEAHITVKLVQLIFRHGSDVEVLHAAAKLLLSLAVAQDDVASGANSLLRAHSSSDKRRGETQDAEKGTTNTKQTTQHQVSPPYTSIQSHGEKKSSLLRSAPRLPQVRPLQQDAAGQAGMTRSVSPSLSSTASTPVAASLLSSQKPVTAGARAVGEEGGADAVLVCLETFFHSPELLSSEQRVGLDDVLLTTALLLVVVSRVSDQLKRHIAVACGGLNLFMDVFERSHASRNVTLMAASLCTLQEMVLENEPNRQALLRVREEDVCARMLDLIGSAVRSADTHDEASLRLAKSGMLLLGEIVGGSEDVGHDAGEADGSRALRTGQSWSRAMISVQCALAFPESYTVQKMTLDQLYDVFCPAGGGGTNGTFVDSDADELWRLCQNEEEGLIDVVLCIASMLQKHGALHSALCQRCALLLSSMKRCMVLFDERVLNTALYCDLMPGILLSALHAHSRKVKVSEAVLHTIHEYASTLVYDESKSRELEDFCESIKLTSVVQCMKVHTGRLALQQLACSILFLIACGNRVKSLSDPSVLDALLYIMETFPDRFRVLLHAMWVLSALLHVFEDEPRLTGGRSLSKSNSLTRNRSRDAGGEQGPVSRISLASGRDQQGAHVIVSSDALNVRVSRIMAVTEKVQRRLSVRPMEGTICAEAPADDDRLRYFTVSDAEASTLVQTACAQLLELARQRAAWTSMPSAMDRGGSASQSLSRLPSMGRTASGAGNGSHQPMTMGGRRLSTDTSTSGIFSMSMSSLDNQFSASASDELPISGDRPRKVTSARGVGLPRIPQQPLAINKRRVTFE
ncbi:hypothetical protein FVE85_4944 [Porphyridium purpureum]|uniref:Uncharacterized protein n=1 Tax=Porphyridium purpureum TaxID=35688 RepID=A0A5J4YTR4_PORPP|nr:hypothetical protein FVE85_4944 [Porphyridium purpureum]|eukprot:POR6634..scf236_6